MKPFTLVLKVEVEHLIGEPQLREDVLATIFGSVNQAVAGIEPDGFVDATGRSRYRVVGWEIEGS